MASVNSKVLLPLLLLTVPSISAAEEAIVIDQNSAFALRDSLELLTPTPRFVSEALARLCVAPTPEAVLSAEVARSGPHANVAVNLYVSPGAVSDMGKPTGRFPEGSVILKEKLSAPGSPVIAVGGMVKRSAGFDPANGDWEYFYAAKSGSFAIGRLPNCIECHAKAKSADFIFSRAFPNPRK